MYLAARPALCQEVSVDPVVQLRAEVKMLRETVDALNAEIEKLKAENARLKEENTKLRKQQGAATVTTDKKDRPTVKQTRDGDYHLGDVARVGDIEWLISDAREVGSDLKSSLGEHRHRADSKFIWIKGRVVNRAKKEVRTLGAIPLIDDKGREYTPIDDQMFFLDAGVNTLEFEALRPDVPVDFEAIYEVPKDTVSAAIRAEELGTLIGAQPKLISLSPKR
jgi:regulator of replication initiation timing